MEERGTPERRTPPRVPGAGGAAGHNPADLSGMREELRLLLPGAQMLTAFPIILPFNQGFARIQRAEQWVYLVTYVCAIGSLVCLRAPAAQHRIERPLRRPVRFKQLANRLIVAGLAFLSLATHLVVTVVIGGCRRSSSPRWWRWRSPRPGGCSPWSAKCGVRSERPAGGVTTVRRNGLPAWCVDRYRTVR